MDNAVNNVTMIKEVTAEEDKEVNSTPFGFANRFYLTSTIDGAFRLTFGVQLMKDSPMVAISSFIITPSSMINLANMLGNVSQQLMSQRFGGGNIEHNTKQEREPLN